MAWTGHTRCFVKAALGALLCCWVCCWNAAPAWALDASVGDAAAVDAAPVDAAPPDTGVPCGTVDNLGQCQGPRLFTCVNGILSQVHCGDTFGPGFGCELVPPTLAAQCVFSPLDAGQGEPVVLDAGAGKPAGDAASGCGCLKPAWGGSAAWMVTLWGLGRWPARRPRRD